MHSPPRSTGIGEIALAVTFTGTFLLSYVSQSARTESNYLLGVGIELVGFYNQASGLEPPQGMLCGISDSDGSSSMQAVSMTTAPGPVVTFCAISDLSDGAMGFTGGARQDQRCHRSRSTSLESSALLHRWQSLQEVLYLKPSHSTAPLFYLCIRALRVYPRVPQYLVRIVLSKEHPLPPRVQLPQVQHSLPNPASLPHLPRASNLRLTPLLIPFPSDRRPLRDCWRRQPPLPTPPRV